ncbi:MAG: hypothetical protein OXU20_38995 [Myxococcales bacterium]|nr:hypothetical protein [Myxococcales bacterium]MDD9971982.1 hypothetical protein [Myxococcales bacterium]
MARTMEATNPLNAEAQGMTALAGWYDMLALSAARNTLGAVRRPCEAWVFV